MPSPADMRAQILLQCKAEGQGELDHINQLMGKLKASAEEVREAFIQCKASGKEYKEALAPITAELGFLKKKHDDIILSEEALVASAKRVAAAEEAALSVRMRSYAKVSEGLDALNAKVNAAFESEALAAEKAAQREADAFAAAAVRHEREMQKTFDANGRLVSDMGRYNRSIDEASASSRRAGYAILNVAHAVQDAQYGFGAVLNNIPLVVQAFGGGPGLAGTMMVAGVGVSLMSGHVKQLATDVGLLEDPAKKARASVDGLKDCIKEMEGKSLKIDTDYREIDEAQRALDKLTKNLAAYEANRETKARKTVEEEAKDVTDRLGGSAGLAAVFHRGSTVNRGEGSDIEKSAEHGEALRRLRSQLATVKPEDRAGLEELILYNKTQQDAIEKRIRDANEKWAMDMAGAVLRGDQEAIKGLKAIVARKPDIVSPQARRGIEKMSITDSDVFEKDMKKKMAKAEAEDEVATRRAADEENRAREAIQQAEVNKHLSAFSAEKAMGKTTQGQIRELIKGGTVDPEELNRKLFDKIEKVIGQGGAVPAERLNEVVRGVLAKLIEKEIAELSGLADVDGTTLQKAAADAIKAADDKAKAKQEKPEITKQAGLFGASLKEGLEDSILRKMAEGKTRDQIQAALEPQIAGRMKGQVDNENIPEVAGKVFAAVEAKLTAQMAGRGGANRATALGMLGERQQKAVGKGLGQAAAGRRVNREAQTEGLATGIFRDAAAAGQPITPDEARHIARRSIDLQDKGMNGVMATQMAMGEALQAMRRLEAKMNGQQQHAGMLQQQFGRIGRNRQPGLMGVIPQ